MSSSSPTTMPPGLKLPVGISVSATPVGKPVEIYFLDGAKESVKAHIRRVNKQFLQLSSPVSIDRERKCQLKFDDCQFPAETVYCMEQTETNSYLVGICKLAELDEVETRESRVSVRLAATLVCAGVDTPFKITITDMSQSGMGIELPRPIAVGEQVAIDLGDGMALGEVRHCRREGGVYRAGVWTDEFLSRTDNDQSGRQSVSKIASLKIASMFDKVRNAIGL